MTRQEAFKAAWFYEKKIAHEHQQRNHIERRGDELVPVGWLPLSAVREMLEHLHNGVLGGIESNADDALISALLGLNQLAKQYGAE